MAAHTVLITGGAGFIGASLALELAARHPDWEVVSLDNLHRRGSELNLPRLREGGVRFVHGDVREPEDLRAAGPFDALVECSAEPSVMAGVDGATSFLVRTNLLGAYHCLEAAARHGAQVIFLSTSRVYPIAALNGLVFRETETRFELLEEQSLRGASASGVAEDFPL
jgi:CDP-paratose 2-epimerase